MTNSQELLARADKYLNTGSGEYASEIMRDMAEFIRALAAHQPPGAGEVREALAILKWLREPDYAENFSLMDLTEWLNRRPVAEMCRIADALANPAPAQGDDASQLSRPVLLPADKSGGNQS